MWYLLAIGAIFGYFYVTWCHKFWSNRGVEQGNPVFLFGHYWYNIIRTQSFPESVKMFYDQAPNSRYCGIYQFLKPTLILRDPDLIKEIAVKNYDHFYDHLAFLPENHDKLWRKGLLLRKGQQWREMRSAVSPAFTSSKMKAMFPLLSETAEAFIQHLLNLDQDVVPVEMKDFSSRYTNDAIANVIFGVKCDSYQDTQNAFYLYGKKATNFASPSILAIAFTYMIFPQIFKLIKVLIFPKEIEEFFRRTIEDTIELREQEKIKRPDMIFLLLEARKQGFRSEDTKAVIETGFAAVEETEMVKETPRNQDLTNEDITAQALQFFLASYESSSTLLSFTSYELAINPEVQLKLIKEVDKTLELCHNQITYDSLMQMTYLDMVVSETLRKWPSNAATDRVCTKPYIIEPQTPNEKPLLIPKGQNLFIPIFGLHRDPKYYPDPDRFNPERFSRENKKNIKPYTFVPFGVGPRSCIGSRLALLKAKMLLFYLLANFQIVRIEKTEDPLRLVKTGFFLTAKNGVWLGLKQRTK